MRVGEGVLECVHLHRDSDEVLRVCPLKDMTYIGQFGQSFGDAVQGKLKVDIVPNEGVVGSHGDAFGPKVTRTFARQGLDMWLKVVSAPPIRDHIHGDFKIPALR